MLDKVFQYKSYFLTTLLVLGFMVLSSGLVGQSKEVINGKTYVSAKKLKSTPKLKAQGLMHKVRKKETLYSISNKYNVDINELIARNPGAESGIVKGDMLIIPVDKVEGIAEEYVTPAEPLGPNQHQVAKQETMYGIAQQHNITIDELREANNGLVDGLKEGEIVNIPVKEEPVVDIDLPDEPIELAGDLVEEINIGLLLPFSFSLVDTNSMPSTGKNIFKMTDIAMEFYRGVQLALQEQMALNVNLFVYDITKEEASIKKFLVRSEVDDLDIIIGPLHGSSFQRISKALKSSDVHIVSPLTNGVGVIENNPSCSKINPSNISHVKYLAEMTYPRNRTSQIIVIDSQLEKDKPLLDKYLATFKSLSGGISPTVIKLSKYNQQNIVNALVSEVPNLLVVPSADKPFVSDFFTRLNDDAMKDYDMQLYGIQPWLQYDNISADQKNRWKLRIGASKYLDYEEEETSKFLKKYYNEFNTIPISQGYGVLGYDIAKFYLDGIYDYGKVFLNHLDHGTSEGIITGFDFTKLPNGGWENNYNMLLRYDSYDLVKEIEEEEEK